MKLIQSPIFAAILGGVLFLMTSAFLTTSGVTAAAHAEALAAEEHEDPNKPNTTGPSWAFFNPEMDQIVSELKSERESLSAKEKQLNELAARVRSERAELEEAVKSIKKIQLQVDRDVFRIKDDEAANLKKLAKMYSSMEPASAAKILRELDDVVVVKILTIMKEGETALILEGLSRLGAEETKRAAAISENLRASAASTAAKAPVK